jgi:cysteine desulfurase
MTEAIAYLDHNATAPVKPAVRAAVVQALELAGNPSSVHRHGLLARRAVERARQQVAALVGGAAERVVFTSGATEANHLALLGVPGRRRLASAVEHDSVLALSTPAAQIPVDRDGVVHLAALERLLQTDRPAMVSVMLANNETGVIQPVAEIAALAHRHGALLHCDAAQGPGRLAIDMRALGVDLLTLSAHKFGGPQGVGALVLGDGVEVAALQHGGGQEFGRRAGTENVPGIVGFGVAAELALADLACADEIAALRDELERRALRGLPAAMVCGGGAPRLVNTSCLAMPGLSAETQVIGLDLAGVAVSAGAACSSGKVKPSKVLAAMGVEPSLARCAIRVSLGPATEAREIDRFTAAWFGLFSRAAGGQEGRVRAR